MDAQRRSGRRRPRRRCTPPAYRWAAARCSTGSAARARAPGSLVRAAAAVSAPLDLTAAGMAIDQGLNRIYARHFLQTLMPKALAMARRFPGALDRRRHRSRRLDVQLRRCRHRAAAWFRRRRRLLVARRAANPGCGGRRAARWCSTPETIRSSRPPRCPIARRSARDCAGAARGRRPRRIPRRGRFPGRFDWLPRRLVAFFSGAAPGA